MRYFSLRPILAGGLSTDYQRARGELLRTPYMRTSQEIGFSEVPGVEGRGSEKGPPMPRMFAHSPTAGRTQRYAPPKNGVGSSEQEAVDRADGRAHRLPQGRSRKTSPSFHGDHIRSAQGGRGGPAAWLREV